jgi:hypothetical protein
MWKLTLGYCVVNEQGVGFRLIFSDPISAFAMGLKKASFSMLVGAAGKLLCYMGS